MPITADSSQLLQTSTTRSEVGEELWGWRVMNHSVPATDETQLHTCTITGMKHTKHSCTPVQLQAWNTQNTVVHLYNHEHESQLHTCTITGMKHTKQLHTCTITRMKHTKQLHNCTIIDMKHRCTPVQLHAWNTRNRVTITGTKHRAWNTVAHLYNYTHETHKTQLHTCTMMSMKHSCTPVQLQAWNTHNTVAHLYNYMHKTHATQLHTCTMTSMKQLHTCTITGMKHSCTPVELHAWNTGNTVAHLYNYTHETVAHLYNYRHETQLHTCTITRMKHIKHKQCI